MTSKTQTATKIQHQNKPLTTLEEKAPGVFLLTMNIDTITDELLIQINAHLDTIEATTGPAALITTSSLPKIYSQGIHFPVFDRPVRGMRDFLKAFTKMLGRFATVGFPTIAAINGHCFAGGTLFAMAHDFRVMRDDYGMICMPEIDIGSPLVPVEILTVDLKIPHPAARRLIVFGEKMFPKTALDLKILDKIVPKADLVRHCVGLGKALSVKAVHREALKEMKTVLYREVYETANGYPAGSVEELEYFTRTKDRNLKELGIKP